MHADQIVRHALAPDGAPGNSFAAAEKWAAGIRHPSYAIDDQTALRVTDGGVDVITEGRWEYFPK